MKISPVSSVNYHYSKPTTAKPKQNCVLNYQPAFKNKHSSAKFLGGLFGTLGTLGAIGGTIIMTGGVALPFVIGYGVASAGSGAILGHIIDKGAEKYDKENKK